MELLKRELEKLPHIQELTLERAKTPHLLPFFTLRFSLKGRQPTALLASAAQQNGLRPEKQYFSTSSEVWSFLIEGKAAPTPLIALHQTQESATVAIGERALSSADRKKIVGFFKSLNHKP